MRRLYSSWNPQSKSVECLLVLVTVFNLKMTTGENGIRNTHVPVGGSNTKPNSASSPQSSFLLEHHSRNARATFPSLIVTSIGFIHWQSCTFGWASNHSRPFPPALPLLLKPPPSSTLLRHILASQATHQLPAAELPRCRCHCC